MLLAIFERTMLSATSSTQDALYHHSESFFPISYPIQCAHNRMFAMDVSIGMTHARRLKNHRVSIITF